MRNPLWRAAPVPPFAIGPGAFSGCGLPPVPTAPGALRRPETAAVPRLGGAR
jgi:hypothetical protein